MGLFLSKYVFTNESLYDFHHELQVSGLNIVMTMKDK